MFLSHSRDFYFPFGLSEKQFGLELNFVFAIFSGICGFACSRHLFAVVAQKL